MSPQRYESEDLLQALLASHPGLLAGDQIDSGNPRRWILVSREVPLASDENGSARWSVDHLFIDQDAIPTIVEVKQSTDTRIRREVVGQILEYAANAVMYWPILKLREQFEKNCELRGIDPEVELNELLEENADPDIFWERVKTNLLAGKVRLVFVADKIPTELQRIVEFLNGQMNPAHVLAIEITQYLGSDFQAFVPRVIGQTVEAQRAKSNGVPSKQWDEDSFFEELSQISPSLLHTARKLLVWGGTLTRLWWGKGTSAGSFVPVLEHANRNHQPFAVWTTGKVELYLSYVRKKPPFNEDLEFEQLISRLNSIPGISLSPDAKLPKIPLNVLNEDTSFQKFIDTFDWYVNQIKNYQ